MMLALEHFLNNDVGKDAHRRDAENAEGAQRVEGFSPRVLRVLCVSAVSVFSS
jgi:hypothetical protein